MMGTGEECGIASNQLEVQQKYLRVQGVYNRNRDVAAGKSVG